jgi:hypothetical protein
MLSAVQETFSSIQIPHFDIPNLDIVATFETISDAANIQATTNEAKKYAYQKTFISSGPLTFCSRIRKWKNVMVDTLCVVLATFMLMGTVQKQLTSWSPS